MKSQIQTAPRQMVDNREATKIVQVMKKRALDGDPGAATVVLMLYHGMIARPFVHA